MTSDSDSVPDIDFDMAEFSHVAHADAVCPPRGFAQPIFNRKYKPQEKQGDNLPINKPVEKTLEAQNAMPHKVHMDTLDCDPLPINLGAKPCKKRVPDWGFPCEQLPVN